MLHRITGRAVKCGPSAISAIADVPTHEAAAVIRRLFDRPSVNGVYTDELAAALEEFAGRPTTRSIIEVPRAPLRAPARGLGPHLRGRPVRGARGHARDLPRPRARRHMGDFSGWSFRSVCRRLRRRFPVPVMGTRGLWEP